MNGILERIMGEYLWLMLGVLSSIVLYTLLFFRLRGNIQVESPSWKNIHVQLHRDSHTKPTAASREVMAVIIWYPICYSIIVVPLIVVRWITFVPPSGKTASDVQFPATVAAITLFGFSGVVSAMLILLTRRDLLLLGPSRGIVNR
jgi:hypothetical protein